MIRMQSRVFQRFPRVPSVWQNHLQGITGYSGKHTWDVWTISTHLFSLTGVQGLTTLGESLLPEFWCLLPTGTMGTAMAGGGGSNIIISVPPPLRASLPGPVWNPFPVEDNLDICVMAREGPLCSGRRRISKPPELPQGETLVFF